MNKNDQPIWQGHIPEESQMFILCVGCNQRILLGDRHEIRAKDGINEFKCKCGQITVVEVRLK